jgi:hypothetical protein
MKNTELVAMLAPASIAVEGGGGWKFTPLACPESRLPAPQILSMPSVAFFSYPKGGYCDYERWAFLPTSVMALHLLRKMEVRTQMNRYASSVRLVTSRQMRVVGRHAHFRPLLCYPMPAAPLS